MRRNFGKPPAAYTITPEGGKVTEVPAKSLAGVVALKIEDPRIGRVDSERFRHTWTVTVFGTRGAVIARGHADSWVEAAVRAFTNLDEGVAP